MLTSRWPTRQELAPGTMSYLQCPRWQGRQAREGLDDFAWQDNDAEPLLL
jgi:hypothetical protein